MKSKKFWSWRNQTVTNQEMQAPTLERTLFLNGTIVMLDEVNENIINACEIKTGLSCAKLSHLMDAETRIGDNSAVKLSFVTDSNGTSSLTRHKPKW